MSERECEVWAIGRSFFRRLKDRLRYRHARHVCIQLRQFAQEHDGSHMCECGFKWPHQSTDND